MPGVRHARWCLEQHMADKRNYRLIKTIDNPKWSKKINSNIEDNHHRKPRRLSPVTTTTSALAYEEINDIDYINDPTIGMNGTKFRLR
jgi:hypothetical protein